MFDRFFNALRKRLGLAGTGIAAGPKARQPPAHHNPPPPLPKSKRWHAVCVRAGHHACAAARDLDGIRFLAAEAPRLPLSGCDADQCHCSYRHFDDRRDSNPVGLEAKEMLTRPMRRDSD